MPLCVLGLGSNKPFNGRSPAELLNSAFAELSGLLEDCRLSPLYTTAPVGLTDQADFCNAAVTGRYGGGPGELLTALRAVENAHGRDRRRERRWGERSLDIDILLFGEQIVNEPDLVIPHPRLRERAFALRPLLDLIPGAREPGTGTTYRKILETLPDQRIEIFRPEREQNAGQMPAD
ncbi:MAG: 2-amino-4-hydroxy-6-hydroxymethyldihydropteridine diphosphokinase [Treponema sp.]|jgi:2-amino-4-hydroxy-6-hydroxymethyldihydropteridine diphosphokinase|nr:2-amino-4-hydroxy-6-hydroxymethyldihydropteridine diphosphokinase [Treponema sp.]